MCGFQTSNGAIIFLKVGREKASPVVGKFFKNKSGQQTSALSAVDLFPGGVPSDASQKGRRLVLKFIGAEKPALDRIEFHATSSPKFEFRQWAFDDDKARSFKNAPVAKALPLFFLDYLCARLQSPPRPYHMEGGNGTPAATLGYALDDRNGSWYGLFVEFLPDGGKSYRVDAVFDGKNWNGQQEEPRIIKVDSDYLPADCFEVFWNDERLTGLAEIQQLAGQFRQVWKLPPPTKLELPAGEGNPQESPPQQQAVLDGTVDTQLPKEKPAVEPAIPAEPFKLSKWLAHEFGQALDILQKVSTSKAPSPKPTAEPKPEEKPLPSGLKPQVPKSALDLFPDDTKDLPPEEKPATPKPAQPAAQPKKQPAKAPAQDAKTGTPPPKVEPEPPPLPRIDPGFFEIPESVGYWPDLAPLIELPVGDDDYLQWTIKNAFEGILIMGRTGSGKTTGGGFTFAESFLKMGFGGLVLTVKKGEAEHWRRLCAHCGREKDLVVVSRGGFFKLNVLAYEAQHPGRSAGLSQNLTSFCRNLLRISSRSQGTQHSEQIWEQAGDHLLNATFDLFLLAGGGITFDRLANFVSAAPTDRIPATEEDWFKVPVFGGVLERAKKAIASPEDQRVFDKSKDYWTKIYAGLSSKTRTSVTLGIYAMFDAFRGRDIPELISGETNMTPECIMSGLIVVLDLPLKEFGHAGRMVQSAWKYLFQTALERHENLIGPKRRPVFLWEDEAQYWFSDHDHHFQDTARSSRVCRVALTQNLHSFYKELGRDGAETANSVFGNLNTKVFHNNSDPQTNEWAAKHFGSEIHMRYSFSNAPPPPARDFFDSLRQGNDSTNRTTVSSGEHWEYAVRPEEFNKLRTGGPENDFLVDAYITWMGLSAENDRHFTKMAFLQNPKL